MKTLILTKNDIKKVLTPSVTIKAVQKAFKAHGLDQVDMPPKSYMYFKKGDLRTISAYIHGQGFNIAGVKSVNVHPKNYNHDLPTVMAAITLTDPKNGYPLALLDGTYITNLRTGAAGALAVKLLCRKNGSVAGFVGCGVQARTQLECIMEVRKLETVKVWKRSSKNDSALRFCDWAEKAYKLETVISSDIDDITTNADILITTTPSRKPLVNEVSPGTHINAIGADATGKQEINPRILKQARLIIDDWAQARHSGEINVPLKRRQLFRKHIYGTLGEITAGKREGRVSDEEITVFDSTGLAIQDISCAYSAYKALQDKTNILGVELF